MKLQVSRDGRSRMTKLEKQLDMVRGKLSDELVEHSVFM